MLGSGILRSSIAGAPESENEVERPSPQNSGQNRISAMKANLKSEMQTLRTVWSTTHEGCSRPGPRRWHQPMDLKLLKAPLTLSGMSSSAVRDKVRFDAGISNPNEPVWSPHSPRSILQSVSPDEGRQLEIMEMLLLKASPRLDEIRHACWKGCSDRSRPSVWRLLLQCEPVDFRKRASHSRALRDEYGRMLRSSELQGDCPGGSSALDDTATKVLLRQIDVDLPRTHPDVKFFRCTRIQSMMRRILYVYARQNPIVGYVQGMNEILSPLIVVFTSEHICSSSSMNTVEDVLALDSVSNELSSDQQGLAESDAFWCLSSIVGSLEDNFTNSHAGIVQKVGLLESVLRKKDPVLAAHMHAEGCQVIHFAFRWIAVLLLREFRLPLVFRLWDSLLAQKDGFGSFLVYACAVLIINWREELLEMEFTRMLMLLLNMPTGGWSTDDVDMLVSQAVVWAHENKISE